MPTNNYYIGEADGWVEVAQANKEVRVSGSPHSHPYFLYAGASAPSLVPVAGTGTITISGLPDADDTVTIGTEVYTFVAAAVDPFEVTIGADADETGDNLVAAITADSELVNGSNAAGTVTVTSKIPGASHNYTLSENAINVVVSGMTGGTDVVEGIAVCHHPFQTTNPMTEKLFARIVNPVPNSKRMDGKLRLDVFTIAP